MNSKQMERALNGPSLFEVTLGAVLSVLLGAAIAVAFLVMKPVVVAKEMPKEEERVQGSVYYLEGKTDASRSRQWHRKRQLLAEGTPGEIAFTEEELNAWLASDAPKPTKKPAPAKPGAAAEEVPEELLTTQVPNVRIRDGVFQVGVPASLNLISFSIPVVVQARGDFEKTGDLWMYRPDEFYLGSMPLHRIPGLTTFAINRFMRSGPFPEDAWKQVSNVSIDNNQLKLTIQ